MRRMTILWRGGGMFWREAEEEERLVFEVFYVFFAGFTQLIFSLCFSLLSAAFAHGENSRRRCLPREATGHWRARESIVKVCYW